MPAIKYKLSDGTPVSGVTTIISGNIGWNGRVLMYWAWNEGKEGRDYKETSKAACEAGTIAHAMIESDLKGNLYVLPIGTSQEIIDKAKIAFIAWLAWKKLVDFTLIASEKSLVSEKLKFGGTIDVAAIKQSTCILDLKTSNATYVEHLVQISAYGQLWNENNPENPVKAYYLLRLGKEDGSFHYSYWPELAEAWEAFKHALELHNLHKIIKKRL